MAAKRRPTTTAPTRKRKGSSSSSKRRPRRKGRRVLLTLSLLPLGAALGRLAENAPTLIPGTAKMLGAVGVAVTPAHQDLAVGVLTLGGLW